MNASAAVMNSRPTLRIELRVKVFAGLPVSGASVADSFVDEDSAGIVGDANLSLSNVLINMENASRSSAMSQWYSLRFSVIAARQWPARALARAYVLV